LLLLEIVRCGRSNPIGSLRFAVVVLVVVGGVIRMIIRILISTATFTRRADDDAASILRDLLMRKRESKRMKDIKSQFHRSKERERQKTREREKTREKNDVARNRIRLLLSLQRRKTRDAQRRLFGRRRSHHLVEQRRVFVSRSLRESNNKSFDIFFYCAEMPKRTKGKCQKNSAMVDTRKDGF
jgi:hypothetical protein